MSSGERIPLAQAEHLAAELVELLTGYCERIEIVGSIRRRTATVGDIELLMIPTTEEDLQYDLFGEVIARPLLNVLDIHLDTLLAEGVLGQREPRRWGPRYKAATYRGFAVDLFSAIEPAQWGVLQVIRTGPAKFSHRLVTSEKQGGWCPEGCRFWSGAFWRNGELLITPTERDVFAAVGRDYVPPDAR